MEVQFLKVSKSYHDFSAVKDFDLRIESGALHFLLGPSGCGKTTVLRMLAGLETPTSGTILLGGKDAAHISSSARGIGMVFQNYALWPHMSVRDNISYGLKIRNLGKKDLNDKLAWVMELTQLQEFAHKYPGQLSGGQQQRVALARALAIEPSILLMDEPLSNLDAQLRVQMRESISQIHAKTKITTVYVTHDQKEALSMGTHITIMNRGRIVQSGDPRFLYNFPRNEFLASFIGETNLIKGVLSQEAAAGAALKVKTPLGDIEAFNHTNAKFQPGSAVTLSIRPEAIRLCDSAQSASNYFPIQVRRNTFLGDFDQIEAAYDDSVLLTINQFSPGKTPILPGQQMWCHVPPQQAMLLEPN